MWQSIIKAWGNPEKGGGGELNASLRHTILNIRQKLNKFKEWMIFQSNNLEKWVSKNDIFKSD